MSWMPTNCFCSTFLYEKHPAGAVRMKGIKGLIRMSKAADKALQETRCGCRAASRAVLVEGGVHILLAES